MDFDEPTNRRGTNSLKWDGTGARTGISGDDVLPMWVAEMDFRSGPFIRDALMEMAESGFLGYMAGLDEMREAVAWWMSNRHGWEISPEDVLTTHGLGNALSLLVEGLTSDGAGVIIFTPVYHEFAGRVRATGRRPVEVPLAVADGRQTFDLDAAEGAIDGTVEMMIVCSPQNPGGRVWTESELASLGDFAARHGLFVIADEIHHDLVYPGSKFIPMETAADLGDRLVTITAPSKTFNTPGLRVGHMIIRNAHLRDRMTGHLSMRSIQPNRAGVVATTAGYSPAGAEWTDALMRYLDGNRRAFEIGVNAIPGVRATPLEATFLEWVDFTGTGMNEAELLDRVQGRARIAVNKGSIFGPGGTGHLRFNIGTQRARIDEAVARLQEVFSDLQ